MKKIWFIIFWLLVLFFWVNCYSTPAPIWYWYNVCSVVMNPNLLEWYEPIYYYTKGSWEAPSPVWGRVKENECTYWGIFLVPENKLDHLIEENLLYGLYMRARIDGTWQLELSWVISLWKLDNSVYTLDRSKRKHDTTSWFKIESDWNWWYKLDKYYEKDWIDEKNLDAYLIKKYSLYIWIACFVVIFLVGLLIIIRKRRNKQIVKE